MTSGADMLGAAIGIFSGTVLADGWFGDGVQSDDLLLALGLAVAAACVQYALGDRRQL